MEVCQRSKSLDGNDRKNVVNKLYLSQPSTITKIGTASDQVKLYEDDSVDTAIVETKKPMLRRCGSSTGLASSTSLDDSYDDDDVQREIDDFTLSFEPIEKMLGISYDDEKNFQRTTTTTGNSSNCFRTIKKVYECFEHTVTFQMTHIFQGFCNNGLPWQGKENCQSLLAGGSGCLYVLPAICCPNGSLEQVAWIVQAMVSVWADYINIHHNHIAHGIDRIFATTMLITIVFRGFQFLKWYMIPIGLLLTTTCFTGASHAKKHKNLEAWHWYHFGWHLSGGLVSMAVLHMIHNVCSKEGINHDTGTVEDSDMMVMISNMVCKKNR